MCSGVLYRKRERIVDSSIGALKDHTIRVMIVDDNEALLATIATLLQTQNDICIVGTASGAWRGLAKVAALQPHVILLDAVMPDLFGSEAIPYFRAAVPKAGIVLMTILDKTFFRSAALAAGADSFVAKSDLNTDLAPTIRKVAQGW